MERQKLNPLILCGVIIATGLVIASIIFAISAGSIADRPLLGSLNGSMSGTVYSGDQQYPNASFDLMTSAQLQDFLDLHPKDVPWSYGDPIDTELRTRMESAITSGKWPNFPYVIISGILYFSKAAVDNWFETGSKEQLVID